METGTSQYPYFAKSSVENKEMFYNKVLVEAEEHTGTQSATENPNSE